MLFRSALCAGLSNNDNCLLYGAESTTMSLQEMASTKCWDFSPLIEHFNSISNYDINGSESDLIDFKTLFAYKT